MTDQPQESLATAMSMAEFIADPWSALADAQAHGAVVETEFGYTAVRRDAALDVLRDRAFVPNFVEVVEFFGVTEGAFHEWMRYSPINTDGEYHKRWRALMSRTFTPRSVDTLRPFLTTTAHQLIDGLLDNDGQPVDFVAGFAHHFPLLALCQLIGVPTDDRARFAVWADAIGMGFNPMELPVRIDEVDNAVTELLDYTTALLALRRDEPLDDLVSRIAVGGAEDGFDDFQLAGSIAGLVFAGHETTKMQLGWMISVIADHPDLWDRVAAAPELAPRVVDEVMRMRSAASNVGRRADADTEVAGCPLHEGDRVLISLWGANHDPAAYPDDRMDIDADREPHLAFGYGSHYCLGAGLAKAELQEALVALAGRATCPALEPGAVWRAPVGINGPASLPVRIAARSA